MELEEPQRIKFVERIIEMLNPFIEEEVRPVRMLLNGGKAADQPIQKAVAEETRAVATVFISYSWDSDEHKEWVFGLANKLVDEGVNVLLDRYDLRPGKSLPHFVETSIKNADRILVIFTPNYKLKAEKRAGGVGYEYSILNSELYKN
ncbi:MAG: hypothetical protein ACI86M_003531 [Saprospiraceae bacterium]|jgi:hypothetical protein